MRFNELIAGVREDIAIKIFGENTKMLYDSAKEAEKIISTISGVGDLRVEQIQGLPQIIVDYDRNKLAQYGLNIRDLNLTLRTAFAGEKAGVVFEEERRFDLVLRLEKEFRQDIDNIRELYVALPNGRQIPLKEVASVEFRNEPVQISRDDAKRRIVIGVNARGRDIQSLVEEINEKLDAELELPPGYYITYGGQFENLIAAKKRLGIAVPVALLLIMTLLFFTFKSLKQALLIFTAIPLSAIGGIYALWLRDMPFSISAGVGFIALFGVAVLNGIVLIAYFNQLKKEGITDQKERILIGTRVRLRPVLMTAAVAALGFLPMALSTSAGAEVQRPLATVVIGGLFTATLLTLLVLPILYCFFDDINIRLKRVKIKAVVILIGVAMTIPGLEAMSQNPEPITLEQAISIAMENHPSVQAASLGLDQQRALRRTALDLGNTTVTYSSGQLNSSMIDYQWQVTQNFKFPTTYVSRSKLLKEKEILSEKEVAISKLELERNVRAAWWDVAYGQAYVDAMRDLEKEYKEFSEVATLRFDAGESGILEKTRAEAHYLQILMNTQKAEADLAIYMQELQRWLGDTDSLEFPPDQLRRLSAPTVGIAGGSNPFLDFYSQNIEVSERAHKLEKSGFLPDFNLGYFSQQIDGVGGLNGVQVGLAFPLFFWAQRGRAQAAKIGVEKSSMEYQNQMLEITAMQARMGQEIVIHSVEIEWYESQGLRTADEILRSARLGYKSGETGYLEYVQSVEQAMTIKTEYLHALKEYNHVVIQSQYVSGGFNN
jgi:cobalt-zinc-cadmium resistance protein CzcA